MAFQMIVDTLKGMRNSGQPLDITIAQTVIQGIISAVAPELFERHTKSGFFSVSRRFARKFVRKHMGWTWRRSTTIASKLPADWESQGHDMAYSIAALVKTYDIPEELVINSDQTALHIRPSTDQTYDVKGVKDVKNLGKDDKRQITCTVSSAASGDLLPLQLIFQGKTTAVVPKDPRAVAARAKGWHLTMSSNHWSNQQTMKEFVDQVIVPWHAKQCE
jgi:hypothetical protein